jgi:DNA-binding beta-propeller fold protein YncE
VTNANDNNISVYSIITGVLNPPSTVTTGGTLPNSIIIDSTGYNAYVANYGSNDISAYVISGGGATLSQIDAIAGGAINNFPAGSYPASITTAP